MVFIVFLLGWFIRNDNSLKVTIETPWNVFTAPFLYDGLGNLVSFVLFVILFRTLHADQALRKLRRERIWFTTLLLFLIGFLGAFLWWIIENVWNLNQPAGGQSGMVSAALGILTIFALENVGIYSSMKSQYSVGSIAFGSVFIFIIGFVNAQTNWVEHLMTFSIGALITSVWYVGHEKRKINFPLVL